MNGLGYVLTGWSAGAASALLSAVWEGTLLAAAVWVVLRMLPRLSAGARSLVWLNVFILIALLHLVPLFSAGSAAGPALAAHAVRVDPRWSLGLAAVWLAFSLFRACQLAGGALHLRQLARQAVPVPVSADLAPLLAHHGRQVELCASESVARPSVIGFFRPRILVPPGLLNRLTPEELRQVVLHEMEHLRRGDDWTNLIQKIALVVFPLNPALAWVERRLCAERELACDDRVLHAGSGRKAYAMCLAHLAEYSLVRRGFGLVLGAWEHRPELVRRVQRILRGPVRGMGRRPALAATGGLVAGALGCALVLAHAPEMVSFAPAPLTRAQIAASLDVRQVSEALGGQAHMVKAEMPRARSGAMAMAGATATATEQQGQQRAARPALVRQTARRGVPATRLASLRTTAPPQGTLLLMTQWTDLDMQPQVMVAFATVPEVKAGGAKKGTAAVHATYAVVRTPTGWLVIQI